MPRPIHFEVPADRPERAIAFYEQVFGWQFHKWDGPMPYWLIERIVKIRVRQNSAKAAAKAKK